MATMLIALSTFLLILTLHCGLTVSQLTWINTLTSELTQTGIPENAAVGTVLGAISATGSTGPVTYSSNSTVIAVNSSSGVVTLQATVSYANSPSFVVRFTATDSAAISNQITADVVVNVLSTNNKAPQFDLPTYSASVLESLPVGTTVYNLIKVTDTDAGLAGSVSVSCQESLSACTKFYPTISFLTTNTYVASIVLNGTLSFSTQNSYSMVIRAVDQGNPPLSSTATVQLNILSAISDIPLFLNAPIAFFISDSQSNVTVLSVVQAQVPRDVTKPLSIRIASDPENWFYVDSTVYNPLGFYRANIRSNGRISANRLLLNYGGRYLFDIQAVVQFNGADTQVSSTTTVTATLLQAGNTPPRFQFAEYRASVSYPVAPQSLVPSLSMLVTDNDVGLAASMTISVSYAPNPGPNLFVPVPTSGQGSMAVSLIVQDPSSLTSTGQFTVTVTASNNRVQPVLSSSAVVYINVQPSNNLPPYFQQVAYSATVSTTTAIGSIILTVSAFNVNAGTYNELYFSIASGDTSYIRIENTTGNIFWLKALNYSVAQSLNYVLRVTNGNGVSNTAPMVIYVQQPSPTGPFFRQNEYDANVNEGTVNLVPPIFISAQPSKGDIIVAYSIVDYGGADSSIFSLRQYQGSNLQQFANLTLLRPAMYPDTPGRQGFFKLIVQARETNTNNPAINNVTVFIYIINPINYPPVFNTTIYQTVISEDDTAGTPIGVRVKAFDADTGPNGLDTYVIGPGGQDNFVIDQTTGIMSLGSQPRLSLDRNPSMYNVTVYAVDLGSPPLSATATVYITVTPTRIPTFDTTNYIFYTRDNATRDTIVGNIRATVQNSPAGITYALPASTVTAVDKYNVAVQPSLLFDVRTMFAVNALNGSLLVGSILSYDYATTVYFSVIATNTRSDPPKSSSASVTVYIRSSFSQPLQFYPPGSPTNQPTKVSMDEQLPIGTPIPYQILAYDLDNPQAVITYSLTNGSDTNGYFSINPTTGAVTVANTIYFNSLPPSKTIPLVIQAQTFSPNRTTQMTVLVSINSVMPQFNPATYTFFTYSNATISQFVGQINATLAGPSPYGIKYGLINEPTGFFKVDPQTGILTVASALTRPTPFTVTFFVSATSNASSNPTVTASVNVTVLNPSNVGPAFIGAPYSFRVPDSAPSGASAGSVSAYDYVTNGKATVMYRIVPDSSTTGNDLFAIDPLTGQITATKPLSSYSSSTPYTLNVSAMAQTPGTGTDRYSYTLVYIAVVNNTEASSGLPYFLQPPVDGFSYTVPVSQPITFGTVKGSANRPNASAVNYYFQVNGMATDTSGDFYINPNTGDISVNQPGLQPGINNYVLTLLIRDNGSPSLSATRPVVIKVSYPNIPSFESCADYKSPRVARVLVNQTAGYVVDTVTACNHDRTDPIYYYITDGNYNNSNPNGNGFAPTFRIVSGGGSGVIYLTDHPDIYNHPVSRLIIKAYNQSVDPSIVAGLNLSQIAVDVYIDDLDLNGPSFSSTPSPSPLCSGIGKAVSRGVRDFPAIGDQIVTMFAGDCDVTPAYRQHTYSLFNISFAYTAAVPYKSPQDLPAARFNVVDRIQQAFTIVPATGDILVGLADFRPYSFGYFTMTVAATDSQGRTDTSVLTVYVVRESDMLKYTFTTPPKVVDRLSNNVASYLTQNSNSRDILSISGLDVHYHFTNYSPTLDIFGYQEWLNRPYINRTLTDLCFYGILGSNVLNANNYQSQTSSFSSCGDCTISMPGDTYKQKYPDRCFAHLTTHWWSGYFWVWWWLIALALLIFIIALILVIVLIILHMRSSALFHQHQQTHVWLDPHNAGSEFNDDY